MGGRGKGKGEVNEQTSQFGRSTTEMPDGGGGPQNTWAQVGSADVA